MNLPINPPIMQNQPPPMMPPPLPGMMNFPMNQMQMMGMMPGMIPPLPPLGFQGSEKINQLEKKYMILREDYEGECKRNKVLEQKCEEYLNQLQRSAEIIESTKGKHMMKFRNSEDKIKALEDMFEQERHKAGELAVENMRFREEMVNIRMAKDGDENAVHRLQDQLRDKRLVIDDMRSQIEKQETMFEAKDMEIVKLKDKIQDLVLDRKDLVLARSEVEEELKRSRINLERKVFTERSLEEELGKLKNSYQMLEEDNIKMESYKNNVESRLNEKERELERLKGELSMMEKMIQINQQNQTKPSFERSSRQEYHEEVERGPPQRMQRNPNQPVYNNSIAPRDTSFQDERFPEERYQGLNENQFRSSPLQQRREMGGQSPQNHPEQYRGKRNSELKQIAQSQAGNINILTWDKPYNKAQRQRNMDRKATPQYSSHIDRMAPNRSQPQSHAYHPLANHNQGGRKGFDGDRFQQRTHEAQRGIDVGKRNSKLDAIPKRGIPREVTRQKYAHEMTKREMKKKGLENQLLNRQLFRDQIKNKIEKLERSKKRTGQTIRQKRNYEDDLVLLNKEIFGLKNDLRNIS